MVGEIENRRPRAREIGRGHGWCVSDVICGLGPGDRPFEERHDAVSIAAVLAGSFQYRSSAGRALLYPGAVLLGRAGSSFVCAHEHGLGDRCVAFSLDPEFFSEIAASITGSYRFRFPEPMLPAASGWTAGLAEAEAAVAGGMLLEERVIGVVEAILTRLSGPHPRAAAPGARDRRRISDAVRHMEGNFDRPLDLAELAGIAGMSRYHFLRTFRGSLGVTPYRLVLDMRMRRAALDLATTGAAVAEIAFAAGFGDLSTFNARFRALFGMSPVAFRRARARAPGGIGCGFQSPSRSSVRASTRLSS